MQIYSPSIRLSALTEDDSGQTSPGADVTVLAAETDVVQVNLDKLETGKFLDIQVQAMVTKGGVAGAVAFYIKTVTITDPWTLPFTPVWRLPSIAAGEIWRMNERILIPVAGASDLVGGLKLTADSPGSNSTVTAAQTFLRVRQYF